MKIGMRLSQNIDCNYICIKIQELIQRYQKEHESSLDHILSIEIVKPQENTDLIPKIEYKNI